MHQRVEAKLANMELHNLKAETIKIFFMINKVLPLIFNDSY